MTIKRQSRSLEKQTAHCFHLFSIWLLNSHNQIQKELKTWKQIWLIWVEGCQNVWYFYRNHTNLSNIFHTTCFKMIQSLFLCLRSDTAGAKGNLFLGLSAHIYMKDVSKALWDILVIFCKMSSWSQEWPIWILGSDVKVVGPHVYPLLLNSLSSECFEGLVSNLANINLAQKVREFTLGRLFCCCNNASLQ